MRKKRITLVTGTEQTRIALIKQLKIYLSDIVAIDSYAIDEGINEVISDDLVLLSSELVKKELLSLNLLDLNCEIIVAKRTINYDFIDEIVLLPEGTEVLFVNDVHETTYESIENLKKIGIDHLKYIPYYPGISKLTNTVEIAVTPGEVDKIPRFIRKTYDIGPRIMDFTTITKILNALHILDEKAGRFSQKYLEKIINIAKRLAKTSNEVLELNTHLNLVIDGLNDGLLVYDKNGFISVANENSRKLLNIDYDNVIGRTLKDSIFNKELLEFMMDTNMGESKVFDLGGTEILINKLTLSQENSVIATFKSAKDTIEANEKLRKQLIKKGFYGKYTFNDIVGKSYKINRVKTIGRKLAQSNLTILIEGESGTGKELFASALHNASKRKDGPFLAVNFSALPDDLIESELFGYEEGAFTGAKKGGKAGLFEQADGGTIFLDEIGDISMKVQARLLRVLQEKEVMRIGGTEIKNIDVRIIAATNRDLSKMVKNKKFREDLYYRLKMGYIQIPPLRERKKDIYELMNYFISIEIRENITIDKEVINELLKYDWYGNVRELKNTLAYMLAVKEGNRLTIRDIPDQGFFQGAICNENNEIERNIEIDNEKIFILTKIYELNKEGNVVGRQILSEKTNNTPYEMSKYQMRNRLDKLERMGLIIKKKGRHGTILTQDGINLVTDYKEEIK